MAARGPIFPIIPQRLYLSGTWQRFSKERAEAAIKDLDIQMVVNVGKADGRWSELLVEYEYRLIPDSKRKILKDDFLELADGVVERLRRPHSGSALVMCYGGRNRSAVLAALVVRQLLGLSGAEAADHVRAVKSTTLLNPLMDEWVRSLTKPEEELSA